MVRLRSIRLRRLVGGGIVYRCFIICCNTMFFFFGIKTTGVLGETSFWFALKYAVGASLAWNCINTGLYYLYHYWFLRLFKMGRE